MASRIIFQDDYDRLDGKPLCEGERIAIKWGGTVLTIDVKIESISYGEGSYSKAYFSMLTRGTETRIYLVGFQAQRLV